MNLKWINSQFLAAVLLTMIWLGLAAFMIQVVGNINDGQRATVCILAIDPAQRTAATANACLEKNGLEP